MAQTVRKLSLVATSLKQRSPMRLVASRPGSKPMREALTYLAPLLPSGWDNYFSSRRAGRYWGLTVQCPVCDEHAPPELNYGNRKWRWLAVHMSCEHKVEK